MNYQSWTEKHFNHCISPFLKLTITIPVRNEAEGIVKTLDALRNQTDQYGAPLNKAYYEVLVLANNCTDTTYETCKAYQQLHPDFNLHVETIELEYPHAHVGTARRLLMDAAYTRLMQKTGLRGIIATTDGDSVVDSRWAYHIMEEMDQGVDVVGGRILTIDPPVLSRAHHLRDVAYRLYVSKLESMLDPCSTNPWPRHFQCYGPSTAVTCEIYDRAGRMLPIPCLEDEEFRKAVKRIDAKIRHSPKVIIYTSSRTQGRVPFGFSVQLKQWEEMTIKGEQQHVDTLETLYFKITAKNTMRQNWQLYRRTIKRQQLSSLSQLLALDLDWLTDLVRKSTYFEALWELIEEQLYLIGHSKIVQAPIASVVQSLRTYFSCDGFNLMPMTISNQSTAIN